jgi:hypothetical protein
MGNCMNTNNSERVKRSRNRYSGKENTNLQRSSLDVNDNYSLLNKTVPAFEKKDNSDPNTKLTSGVSTSLGLIDLEDKS